MKYDRYKLKLRNYYFPGIIALVIAIVLYKFTVPQITQIMEVRKNLKNERARLERLVQKSTVLDRLDEQSLRAQFMMAQEALPADKNVAGFLFTISRLVNEASLSVSQFQTAPGLISTPSASPSPRATASGQPTGQAVETQGSPAVSPLEFRLVLSGEPSAIRDFLERVKKAIPLIVITTVDFHQSEKESPNVDLRVIFSYQSSPTLLGKIDDSLPILTSKDYEVIASVSNYHRYSQTAPATSGGKLNPFK